MSETPLISCIMPTYGRPGYLGEAVEMFLAQDYPAKELILLNDCPGQTFRCELPGVQVVNVPRRYPSLGEKRNAAIEMSAGEIIAVWDDDDVHLPWRLSFSMSEMRRLRTEFYRPAEFWAYWGDGDLHDNQSVESWVNHGLVLFSKQLWERVGGYPAKGVGEDAEFFTRIHTHLAKDFIKYPLEREHRFYVLRGKSHYRHMCMAGGEHPLDTSPQRREIIPLPIQDRALRERCDRLVELRREMSGTSTPLRSGRAAPPAPKEVVLFEGFFNRLNGLVNALLAHGPEFRVRWAVNSHLPHRFGDLFNDVPGLEVSEETGLGYWPRNTDPANGPLCYWYVSRRNRVSAEEIAGAYRHFLGYLRVKADVAPAALGIHYRGLHHSTRVTPEEFARWCLGEARARGAARCFAIADSGRELITDILEQGGIRVSWGRSAPLRDDLDRGGLDGIRAFIGDALTLAGCTTVLTSFAETTIVDSARAFGREVVAYSGSRDGSECWFYDPSLAAIPPGLCNESVK